MYYIIYYIILVSLRILRIININAALAAAVKLLLYIVQFTTGQLCVG